MFEIELPVCDGGISHIEFNAKRIVSNMLICAKPGQIRHTVFPFKCYYVHMIIHDDTLQEILINAPVFLETDMTERYHVIFERLIKCYHTFAESEALMLQSLVLELIYRISREPCGSVPKRNGANHAQTIERALRYIKEHLTEELTLETVSKAVSVSPVYFHNLFKKAVGRTLRVYVEEQRIKKAANLLLSSNDTLTQIAFECGFSSQSYFSCVFKRKMKMTPREYVKEIYEKYEV